MYHSRTLNMLALICYFSVCAGDWSLSLREKASSFLWGGKGSKEEVGGSGPLGVVEYEARAPAVETSSKHKKEQYTWLWVAFDRTNASASVPPCWQRAVGEVKGRCEELEKQFALKQRLSFMMMNCHLADTGRVTYSCHNKDMTLCLKQLAKDDNADSTYRDMLALSMDVCAEQRQDLFRRQTEAAVNTMGQSIIETVDLLYQSKDTQDELRKGQQQSLQAQGEISEQILRGKEELRAHHEELLQQGVEHKGLQEQLRSNLERVSERFSKHEEDMERAYRDQRDHLSTVTATITGALDIVTFVRRNIVVITHTIGIIAFVYSTMPWLLAPLVTRATPAVVAIWYTYYLVCKFRAVLDTYLQSLDLRNISFMGIVVIVAVLVAWWLLKTLAGEGGLGGLLEVISLEAIRCFVLYAWTSFRRGDHELNGVDIAALRRPDLQRWAKQTNACKANLSSAEIRAALHRARGKRT